MDSDKYEKESSNVENSLVESDLLDNRKLILDAVRKCINENTFMESVTIKFDKLESSSLSRLKKTGVEYSQSDSADECVEATYIYSYYDPACYRDPQTGRMICP